MIENKLQQLFKKLDHDGVVYKDQIDEIQIWSELMMAKQEMSRFYRSKEVHDLDVSEDDDHDK
jgi:hypothetical protein